MRVTPLLMVGALIGALVASLLALLFVPFLVRRMVPDTGSFEMTQLTELAMVIGAVLGFLAAAVARVAAALMRRADDPPRRRPQASIRMHGFVGLMIGLFFGIAMPRILFSFFATLDPGGRILLTPTAFFTMMAVTGAFFGIGAAGFVVGFVPRSPRLGGG